MLSTKRSAVSHRHSCEELVSLSRVSHRISRQVAMVFPSLYVLCAAFLLADNCRTLASPMTEPNDDGNEYQDGAATVAPVGGADVDFGDLLFELDFPGGGGGGHGLLTADGGPELSEQVACPWSRTGKCLCGTAPGGSWEFSCPLELEADNAASVTFNVSDGLGGDDDDGGGGGGFARHSYVMHSYPVMIQFVPDSHVSVKCTLQAVPNDLLYLKDHNFTQVRSVEFYSCPVPPANETYSSLIASMGIPAGTVEHLFVRDVTRGGWANASSSSLSPSPSSSSLPASQLAGLSNLTYLSVRAAGVVGLAAGFLSDLPRLTRLDLSENGVASLGPGFLDAVPGLKVLDLRSNALGGLPDGFFAGVGNLETLHLNGNRLGRLDKKFFQGLDKLKVLELRSNQLGPTIAKSTFEHLASLKWLSLANNSVESLPADLFNATPKLEILVVSLNPGLASLPEEILHPLADLTSLDLDHNGFSSLPDRLLANASKLVNATFANQRISTIPPGFFAKCASLEKLDLRRNAITTLPDAAFAGLSSLRRLDLSDNGLEAVNDALLAPLKRLETLVLSRNRLARMSPYALRSNAELVHFDAADNLLRFSVADPFRNTPFGDCVKLRTLNLERNQISAIYEEWRVTPTRLQNLNLRSNKLTSLTYLDLDFTASGVDVDLRDNEIRTVDFYDADLLTKAADAARDDAASGNGATASETTVRLSGNPLTCDCRLFRFARYLTSTSSGGRAAGRRVVIVDGGGGGGGAHLRCAAPAQLENSTVVGVPLESLTCNVTDSCPDGCSCVDQPSNDNFIVRCLRGVPANRLPEETTILHLENNAVTSLARVLNESFLPSNGTLKEVYLGGNRLRTFEAPAGVPRSLSLLDVSYNNLTRMPTELLADLVRMAPELRLGLSGNPWVCDCETRPFFDFVLDKFSRIRDLDAVRCAGSGRSLHKLRPEDLCPEAWRPTVWATSTFGVIVVALLLLAVAYIKYGFYLRAWLYARKWGLPLIALHDKISRRMEEEEGCTFDAFISYSSKDEEFVVGELSPGLEHGNPAYKLNLHFRDWKPGEFIQDQVYTAVSQSRRTLVILSENYVNSVWGRAEFRVAHMRALQERADRVIVVLYGALPPREAMDDSLKTYVSLKTYLKWGDSLFWERLRYALSPPLNQRKPADPAGSTEMGVVNKGLQQEV